MKFGRPDYNLKVLEKKIPANEPVFLLRAQDPAAAGAVRAWADKNEEAGGDSKLSELARKNADEMEAWQKKKPADM